MRAMHRVRYVLMPRLLSSNAVPASPWAARRADDEYGVSSEPNWRGVDWRSHLHRVEVEGRSVNYVDMGEGEGPPVVLVHGLGGQWQNWLENIPRVAQERRVVALDLPGQGASEMPEEEISISGYGRCVDALCEQLGLGEVALVGNSMGGFVSAETAIRYPKRVDRLVLVSAAGITSADLKRSPGPVILRIGGALATYGAARHRKIAARPVSRHLALALVARHPSRLAPDMAYEGLMRGTGKPGFDDAMRATLDYDFRDRLPEISCPTLIVWGEKDVVLPAKDAEEFERLIPDSRKVVLADTGHIPQVERPRAFNECLLEFLEGERAGRPAASEEAAA
jgi:pimeloyl-ACP methyl ester carboxylesterase